MKPTKPPLVEVTWVDAIERDVSCKLSEVETGKSTALYTRLTTGYLVRCDAEVVSLTREFDPPEPDDDEATVGKFCNIPAGWVKNIRYLSKRPHKAGKRKPPPEAVRRNEEEPEK